MFTLVDISGFLLSVLLYVPLLILPGYALARALGVFGFAAATPLQRLNLALLTAVAVMPVVTANLSKWFGLQTCLALVLVCAVFGAIRIWQDGLWRPTRGATVAFCLWSVFVCAVWIDVEWNGQLFMSLLSVDMIKHSAITRSLVDSGAAPPSDPFFHRNGPASFYYFYFVPAALAEVLAGGLADSRMVVGGQVVWTGAAIVGLATVLYDRSGFVKSRSGSPTPLIVALMMIAGLQIVIISVLTNPWPYQSTAFNDMVGNWLISVLWVPHHISGFIASWMALLWLSEADRNGDLPDWKSRLPVIVCCGAGFASAAGLSTWVTFGTVATAGLWSAVLLYERRYRAIGILAAAGVVSLVLAAPYLLDVLHGRESSGAVVALHVRRFVFSDSIASLIATGEPSATFVRNVLRLVTLPINYFFEAGFMMLAAILFWLRTRRDVALSTDVARLLAVSAVAALVVGSFMKSAIANNDLGWRVLLFAQMAALLWATHLMTPIWERMRVNGNIGAAVRRVPRAFAILMAIGVAGVAYDVTAIRFWQLLGMHLEDRTDSRVDLETRQAYEWLNANVDRKRVTQHNPDVVRAFPSALYGRNPVAISDWHTAQLLGADLGRVSTRMRDVSAVFRNEIPLQSVVQVLVKHGVNILIFTALDPIWQKQPNWMETIPTLYRTPHVRIYDVDRLSRTLVSQK